MEIALAQGVISEAPKLGTALSNAANFLLYVFGIIAIIGLIISGSLYLLAGGNQRALDIAKKSFRYAIAGIMLTLGVMVLINLIGSFII